MMQNKYTNITLCNEFANAIQIAVWYVILLRRFSTGYHVEIYNCKHLQ